MYDALVAEVNKITKAEFEIIFINDGSKDRTFEKNACDRRWRFSRQVY